MLPNPAEMRDKRAAATASLVVEAVESFTRNFEGPGWVHLDAPYSNEVLRHAVRLIERELKAVGWDVTVTALPEETYFVRGAVVRVKENAEPEPAERPWWRFW